MENKASKAIVIDASIARSTGISDHPTSRMCRDFLQAVMAFCHKMAANPELLAEWRKHMSKFSSRWLVSMMQKRRLVRLPKAANKELWAAFGGGDCPEKDYRNISKDLHLVDAAMCTDRRVASLDDAVRTSLRNCMKQKPEIGDIAWVNPTNEAEQAIDWLERGAPREPARLLRHGEQPVASPDKQKG